MKARIFFWSITSALAGFLFGFDTVVISGAEQKIQSLWNLSPGLHGMAMDAISRITRVDISIDGEPPMLAAAVDGVFDQSSEAFDLDLPESVVKGSHTLLLQVTDEAGNTGALRLPIGP